MSKKRVHQWQRVTCPQCQGRGTVVVAQDARTNELVYSYRDCARCQGMCAINVSQKELDRGEARRRRPACSA
jgi:DnaJ-class molecular chaperone